VRAGDVVVLAHDVWHKSEANLTNMPRRAFLVQFSQLPVLSKDGHHHPLALALPL
jgi:ectoine hydroxylase-related dioxygenase (phytanoyl-CoA dioxygenase family)